MKKGLKYSDTYTIVGPFPSLLRWRHEDDILGDGVHRNVCVHFQRDMDVDLLLNNRNAAHDDPLRLARGPNPCLRRSRVLVGGGRREFFIGIQDSDGTRPYSPALLDPSSLYVSCAPSSF